MIIDIILDRKDGKTYDAKKFYDDISEYGNTGWGITSALDGGTNEDVQNALCDYVLAYGYNESICDYIRSLEWVS